jgi:hypothetical protein
MSHSQRKQSQDRATINEIVAHFEAHPVRLSDREVTALLADLCASLGYGLSPVDHSKVITDPPTDPKRFANLVMELEGVGTSDADAYEPVLMRVLNAFRRAAPKSDR